MKQEALKLAYQHTPSDAKRFSELEGEPILCKKTDWQKDDCIACDNPSTLEVQWFRGRVRCCDNELCIAHATFLAGYSKLH